MKRAIFSLFFICLFLCPALADYTVDEIIVNAEVEESGKTQVTATIQLTFDAEQNQVTLPLPDGDISRVSEEPYHYRVEETDTGMDVVVTDDSLSGTQTFTVSYTVASADDSSEEDTFSLGLLSSRWARAIDTLSFQVTLPQSNVTLDEAFTLAPSAVSGYYGALSTGESNLEVNGTVITGTVSKRMAYDSLSLEATLPEGYFKVYSTSIPMISVSYFCLVMAGLTLLLIIYWRTAIRTPHQSVTTRLLTPGGILPCQLPQALDGRTCDVAALILEWANLGYLTIRQTSKGYLVLTKVISMGSERSRAEQRLFRQIFSTAYRVAATPGRYARAAARFRASSRKSFARVAFDRKGGNPVLVQIPARLLLAVSVGYMAAQLLPEGAGFLVVAVLLGIVGFLYSLYLHSALTEWAALGRRSVKTYVLLLIALALLGLGLFAGAVLEMLVGLFACCFSALATSTGPRRSQRGQDYLAQTKGLKLYYQRVAWTRIQTLVGRNSRFFQHQLPKAVALGADKYFAQRFEHLPAPCPEWLEGRGPQATSTEELQKRTAQIVKALREAFR